MHTHCFPASDIASVFCIWGCLRPPCERALWRAFCSPACLLAQCISSWGSSGLLWGTTSGCQAQEHQEAMLHQTDGLCEFSVSLPATHLSNCLSAFNHPSLHISTLEFGCIALRQNGIYSGLCH